MALYRDDSEFLTTARDRFKLADTADSKQSAREREAIAFEDGDQWPADVKTARKGLQPTGGQASIPARPTLVINKVKEPVRQILNQERSSDIGVELVPADDFGDLGITPDDTEVLLREGMVRRIQRDSNAADARTWAFKRAVIAGRGYYMVMTRYLPGQTWDQEVYIHRIFNQDSVRIDPAHVQPDGSDADWGFVSTWMQWDKFKATNPNTADGDPNPLLDCTDSDFVGMSEAYPEWYANDGNGHQAVRITDYVYAKHTTRTLCLLPDGSSVWEDEVPEGVKPQDTRTVVEKQFKFSKIAGGVVELERTDWPGPDFPIIKVIGDEVLPYDDQRRYNGVVSPAMDAGRGENYMISKMVETIGLSPIPPLMVDPDAIDGYESEYEMMNVRAMPYLKYRTRDDQGQELRPPTRPPVTTDIQAISQAIGMFDAFVKSTTAVPDSTMGNVDPSLKSGRAIREVVANAQMSTSNFLDNLARSMRYEAQVINNLLWPVYASRPGRLVRILTGEGESQTIQIDQPEDGGQPGGQMALQQKAQKVAKLTKDAKFNIAVKIAKNTESRRNQFVQMFGDILGADPQQMAIAGDLFYRNMDIPEARQLAKRMRTMLAPPVQAMLAKEEQGVESSPEADAQIAQLTEQLQAAEAAMAELSKKAEGKEIDAQAKLQVEQMATEKDVRIAQLQADIELEKARMDNATKIHVAEIAARTKGIVMAHESEHEAVAMAHEAVQAELDRQHQSGMATQQAEVDADDVPRVVTPDGGVHEFPTVEQAEAFKQAAGLSDG